ncbi:uncharacterized protein K02A2.6-like [Uranotaenia lowii]|uniref:uncharacterized protein K02A2.6-like n=1 Tax=Uranotaenia lowii TaxID=190385 RepID=UPI0024797A17|nr:uncharacterized protein K02A2.6-like [Uranotaenia lowii]
MVKQFLSNRESLAVVKGCLMIPNSQRILEQLYRGHPGIERVKAVARSYVFWSKIVECITEYIERCSSCASFLGTNSSRFRWSILQPTFPDCRRVRNELFSRFSVPETIVTDNGTQFTSANPMVSNTCELHHTILNQTGKQKGLSIR